MDTEKATIVDIFSFSLRILGFFFIDSTAIMLLVLQLVSGIVNASKVIYSPFLLCLHLHLSLALLTRSPLLPVVCRLEQSLNICLTSFYYVQISSSCYLAIRFKFHFKILNRCHRFLFIFSQNHLNNISVYWAGYT